MPRVSVLTPIYNTNPAHLRECIDSILNQTFKDFEFIIVNDSPENKELDKIVSSYKDPRIKYFKNKKNIGISATRNRLLKLAKGEYLAIFDHDDISVPERLALEVEYLDNNPYVGVVSGWVQCFGTKNDVLKNPEKDIDIKVHLLKNCYVAHTAAMIRKSVLTKNNIEYEEYYTPAEDYRLWARLMDVTHFYNFQKPLVYYRTHENMTTISQNSKMYDAWQNISTELRNKYPAYYDILKRSDLNNGTIFRLRLFGIIPLMKIKNKRIYLFEFIPVLTIKNR